MCIPHVEPLFFSLEPDSLALCLSIQHCVLRLGSYPRLVLQPGELPFPALVCDCLSWLRRWETFVRLDCNCLMSVKEAEESRPG